jgi:hypothetical protein
MNDVDFFHTRLAGADLSRAILSSASLRDVDLSETDLRNGSLQGALLRGVNARGTNFEGALLSSLVVERATFERVSIGSATVGNNTWGQCDLRGVGGLESVTHLVRSNLSIDCLLASEGQIPEVFLRGCGLPDSVIAYVRSLALSRRPIDLYSCFISYSSKDSGFCERLYADLQSAGVRCWFAPEDLKIGDRIRDEIEGAIRVYDKLLLVLSEHSVASSWVESEVENALERERQSARTVLCPIRLDVAVLKSTKGWAADVRRIRHIGDFTGWKDHDQYQTAFQRLLRDLKGTADKQPSVLGVLS